MFVSVMTRNKVSYALGFVIRNPMTVAPMNVIVAPIE